ncbi:MAG: heavy-metal-associated domain-containing protein [Steroidobacteraceae bacterium]
MRPEAANGSAKEAGTIVLAVCGMTCGGCANAVARALSRVPGVSEARVDLASERATVVGTAPVDELTRALEAAGFGGRQA